jgi:hypothetical protein
MLKGLCLVILIFAVLGTLPLSSAEPSIIWETLGGEIYIIPIADSETPAVWETIGANIFIYVYKDTEPLTWVTLGAQINVSYEFPPWDLNQDGYVNYLDASIFVSSYLDTGPSGWIMADINDDGIVNYLDASILVSHYGEVYV